MEFLPLTSLALFPEYLALDLLRISEHGLFALLHAFRSLCICRIEEAVCCFLLEALKDRADTAHILLFGAVNVLVNRPFIWERRPGGKELEKIRG